MEQSISELVSKFVSGDNRAFEILIRRYRQKIYSLAFQMLGNHLDADEVVQETFVRVFKRRQELSPITHFSSFLIRIATNYTIDLLRKKKIQAFAVDDPQILSDTNQEYAHNLSRQPDELYRDKLIMLEIKKAMNRLPARQKMTIVLHDLQGLSNSEIAKIMECPEATVRSNLHIARSKLKNVLKIKLDNPGIYK